MPEPIPIAQKLGCDKHAIDSRILVKSSVEKVSAIFNQYFGSECGYLLKDYWEINVEFELCTNWLYKHHFKSSIRSVSESDGILALSANKEEKGHRGFLDACLKYLI